MESSILPVSPENRRKPRPSTATEMDIGIFAPPLVEPFQPSLTLPYLGAQMRHLGFSPVFHNLSSLFYIWLFRRVRLASMSQYHTLSKAIGVLRDPVSFYDADLYHKALEHLEGYVEELAQKDGLPYSLYPASTPSAVARSGDYRALIDAMPGTLLERFLQDYVGFTLQLESYDVIAFSATNAFQLACSLFIGRMLKNAGIPAHLILGGHAVYLAGRGVFDDPELSQCVDAVVVSGGADVFATVCHDLLTGKEKFIYGTNDVLPEYKTDVGSFPIDMPYKLMLQHDIHDLYLSSYQVFSIYSALGCSYGACTFCGSNRENAPYVPRSISALGREIDGLNDRYRISHFNICDNNFDPNRAAAFCDELERREQRVLWQCTSRVYKTLTVELLTRMRKLGCVLVNIGLESGSNRLLKLMRKGYTVSDAEDMLNNMDVAGMNVHLYCICAFPTETEEESEQTLSFLKAHLFKSQSIYFQDYEAQLASSVFTSSMGTETRGYSALQMIENLLADKDIAAKYTTHGNLVRRKGYPFIEDHNFLYLANEYTQL